MRADGRPGAPSDKTTEAVAAQGSDEGQPHRYRGHRHGATREVELVQEKPDEGSGEGPDVHAAHNRLVVRRLRELPRGRGLLSCADVGVGGREHVLPASHGALAGSMALDAVEVSVE